MLDLVEYPSKDLKWSCAPVTRFDALLKALADEMATAMYAGDGVGLAAPQVGATSRVLVMDPSGGKENGQLLVMVNPEVTWAAKQQVMGEEGCLSLPGIRLQVPRAVSVEVKYFDLEGKEQVVRWAGWQSRIAQHEIDHLDGILMLDRVGPMQRQLALKSLRKSR